MTLSRKKVISGSPEENFGGGLRKEKNGARHQLSFDQNGRWEKNGFATWLRGEKREGLGIRQAFVPRGKTFSLLVGMNRNRKYEAVSIEKARNDRDR